MAIPLGSERSKCLGKRQAIGDLHSSFFAPPAKWLKTVARHVGTPSALTASMASHRISATNSFSKLSKKEVKI